MFKLFTSRSGITGIVRPLLPIALALSGSAHAQLEALGRTADLRNAPSSTLQQLYSTITGDPVFQITFSGTINTTTNDGSGPIFGLSGSSLPFVAHVMIDTAKAGPTETIPKGTSIDERILLSNLVGYKGDQIMAIHMLIGDPAGANKEIGYLNIPGLQPLLPATQLDDRMFGSSQPAQVWLNEDLNTSSPTAGLFYLRGTNTPSSDAFQIGTTYGTGSTLDFSSQIFVNDSSGGNFSLGDITSVSSKNLAKSLATYLKDRKHANKAYTKDKKKVSKLEKKLKKAKGKEKKKLSKKLKKAKKAKKKSLRLKKDLKYPY